jgi:hypothetical protein
MGDATGRTHSEAGPCRAEFEATSNVFKVAVAINTDKEANIFNVAHFGIVADYKEVLPALTAKLKELQSK